LKNLTLSKDLSELLKPRFIRDDGSRRYTWGEWSPAWGYPSLHLTNLGNDDDCLTLIIGIFFCTFYIKIDVPHKWEMWENAIGFYFSEEALVLEWPWGGRQKHGVKKFLYYPWSLDFYKRWEAIVDGGWSDKLGGWDPNERHWVELPRRLGHGKIGTKAVYDFKYVLKSGEVQERKATVYVDRMEWRRRWLRWTPLFNLVRDCINVSFDGEVGERTGSWKGGCTGCGYELKPGESIGDCLARMERERKFK
jgi:hypothetical protein